MAKKSKITDEEAMLFLNSMDSVKKLNSNNQYITESSKGNKEDLKYRKVCAEQFDESPYPIHTDTVDKSCWIGGDENISFSVAGVQPKILQKLKRGQFSIEARLDLHSLTATEAVNETELFIENCHKKNIKCVILIHGKGTLGQYDKPVLKNIINRHLRNMKNVIAFHSAKPKHGGSGAIYILIRSRSSYDD